MPEIAPWREFSGRLLLWCVRIQLAILIILCVLAPFTVEEGAFGQAYLDVISLDIGSLALTVVSVLFASVTVASMWDPRMAAIRNQLVFTAIAGLIATLIFYSSLAWWGWGDDLWQGPGLPGLPEFKQDVRSFSKGSALFFVAVLFGLAGANISALFRTPGSVGSP